MPTLLFVAHRAEILWQARDRIMLELMQVSASMVHFIFAVNEAILIKHVGVTAEVFANINITDAPGVFDVGLRFYVEVPDSGPPTSRAP